MSKAVWTPVAEAELDEVLYYIAIRAKRPATGESNYFEIRRLADEYARQGAPRHTHPDAPEGWHYFRHKRWLIFYRPHPEGIEIMRVIDGSRDLPRQFPASK
ncbi:MAG: type II toxin-antitoxin system RelE/ParE family toxin [Pirellulales bacterium]